MKLSDARKSSPIPQRLLVSQHVVVILGNSERSLKRSVFTAQDGESQHARAYFSVWCEGTNMLLLEHGVDAAKQLYGQLSHVDLQPSYETFESANACLLTHIGDIATHT